MINKTAQDKLRYRVLHAAARLVRGGRRRTLKIAATWPLGGKDHHRLAAHPGHPTPHLTSTNPSRRARKETPGPVELRTRPASRATVIPRA
jgi:hypothetical protein